MKKQYVKSETRDSKKCNMKRGVLLIVTLIILVTKGDAQVGTWTQVSPSTISMASGLVLLTDGSVIAQGRTINSAVWKDWAKLTPDINGNYANGGWSTIASMHESRYPITGQVLKSGKVYVGGGETGTGYKNAEVYDPLLNSWNYVNGYNTSTDTIGTEETAVLPDGKIMQGMYSHIQSITTIYDPVSNSFTPGASVSSNSLLPGQVNQNGIGWHCYQGNFDEASWVKLKDGSILLVDQTSELCETRYQDLNIPGFASERFIPNASSPTGGDWFQDDYVTVDLFGYGETGPGVLLPDGRAIFFGGNGKTAIYDPVNTYLIPNSNNVYSHWTEGPPLPIVNDGFTNNTNVQLVSNDCAAAMMVNGKILLTLTLDPGFVNTYTSASCVYFYEYDYQSTLPFTQVHPPTYPGSYGQYGPYNRYIMLDLPDGKVLMTDGSNHLWEYTPIGTPNNSWKPTISTVSANQVGCGTYTITGTLFNGMSEGAYFGDDFQMATNYPIVRLTSGSNVYYARTHEWDNTGVQTGTTTTTTLFTLPPGLPSGTYSLSVIANGIASDPVNFTVASLPSVTANINNICIGQSVTLTATGSSSYVWSDAETTAQITVTPTGTTTYTVTGTTGAICSSATITITATQLPITGTANYATVCAGHSVILTGGGGGIGATYSWSGGISDGVAFYPTVTTTYTVQGINQSNTCSNTATVTITVGDLPVIATATASFICPGNPVTLSGAGGGPTATYIWNGGVTDGVPFIPTGTATYTVTGTDLNGCSATAIVAVEVSSPTGTLSGGGTICIGSSTNLSLTFTGNSPWYFKLNDGMGNAVPYTTANNPFIIGVSPTISTTYSFSDLHDGHGCIGAASGTAQVDVLSLTSPLTGTAICSGGTFVYTPTSNILGAVYSWTRAAIAGINGGTGITIPQTTNNGTINEVLINSSANIITVSYIVSETSTTCNYTQTVTIDVIPSVTLSSDYSTVCSNNPVMLTANGSSTYTWSSVPTDQLLASQTNNTLQETPVVNTIYTVTGVCGTASVTVNVNPLPVGSVSSQTICSGYTSGISLNSTLPGTTFDWTASMLSGSATGFSGCMTGCGTTIVQTLTNISNTTDAVVRYIVTPTSPLGCAGATFTVDVTVNPKPSGSTSNATICSGTATNVLLNSSLSGTTYNWTGALFSGSVTGFSASGSGSPIVNTLTNTSNSTQGQVRYTITPVSAVGCAGSAFLSTITVNPSPMGLTTGDETLCNGDMTGAGLSTYTTGTPSFIWTASGSSANVTGYSDCTSGCGNTISQTLTNTGNTDATVVYTIIPTSAANCEGSPFTLTETVGATPVSSASNTTIFSGAAANVNISSSIASTDLTWTSFVYSGSATGNIDCPGGCGTAITDVLTNTGTTQAVVRYTITSVSPLGCPDADIIVDVTINPVFNVGLNIIPESACGANNGSATVTPTGGSGVYTYLWTPGFFNGQGTSTVTGLSGGLYYVTVSDNMGSTVTLPVSVSTIGTTAFVSFTANTTTNAFGTPTSVFTSTTQIWTPTHNPFGGTSSNQVSNVTILGELVIPPGMDITITNMTFNFKRRTGSGALTVYGARVLVENSTDCNIAGGKLTLNVTSNGSAKFTNYTSACIPEGMWEGVEVWGDDGTPQTAVAASAVCPNPKMQQGYFRTIGLAVKVQNAYIGALAGKRLPDFSIDPVHGGGGIIYSYNSKFWNNQYDVYFQSYNVGTNQSAFFYTQFNTVGTPIPSSGTGGTGHLISSDGAVPLARAYLSDTKGISFYSCTFTNNTVAGVYSQTLWATNSTMSRYLTGIYADNSEFFVYNNSSSGTGTLFNRLQYGIYAKYVTPTKTMTVDRNTFSFCYRSIYLSGSVLTASITGNSIDCYPFNTSVSANYGYGIYLDQLTNGDYAYKIEGNKIFRSSSQPITYKTIGIIANETGEKSNQIYHNQFWNLWNGIQAQGVNYHYNSNPFAFPHNDNGLKILCNIFRNGTTGVGNMIGNFDMGITLSSSGLTPGIHYFQRQTALSGSHSPAGNLFSNGTHNAFNDYYSYGSNALSFIQYNDDGGTGTTPNSGRYTSPNVTPYLLTTVPNGCAASFPALRVTKPTADLKNMLKDYQPKIDSTEQLLYTGSMKALFSYFSDTTVSASNLKDSLLVKSPYLSDEILIAAIKDTDNLNENDIADIVIANSPITQIVKDTLTNIPLSATVHALIDSAQSGTSAREKAEDYVINIKFERNLIQGDIIRSELNNFDTIPIPKDTIIKDLNAFIKRGQVDKADLLAYYYIDKGDYGRTDSITDMYDTIYEKQNLSIMIKVYKQLKQNGKSIYDIIGDANLQQMILQVVNDSTRAGYTSALGILQKVYGLVYHEPIYDSENEEGKSMIVSHSSSKPYTNAFIICYPNPSNEVINFKYLLPDGSNNGVIIIFNSIGEKIKEITLNNTEDIKIYNLSNLSCGLYYYTLIVSNTTIARDKFIINK